MKGNPAKLLADTPSVDGSKSENRSLPERLPVRRIGLEQEFFLVDRSGVLRDLADPYLRRCREAAQAAGFDPRCFKAECVKSLVEISTLPSSGIEEVAKEYLNNLHLALGVASELGLALYPLGTIPSLSVLLCATIRVTRSRLPPSATRGSWAPAGAQGYTCTWSCPRARSGQT
jgi:Glutamate-cysteine ligase family 2(GCS2)